MPSECRFVSLQFGLGADRRPSSRSNVKLNDSCALCSIQITSQVIAAKEAGASAPVKNIDGNTFIYIRHKDMFFVAVTRSNSNVGELP